tara:strand:- start:1048 stop:2736 length:1689 start_codon:yes stop_codon:yes gene_type:complete
MGFFTPFVYRKGVTQSGGGNLPNGFDVLDGHNAIIWLDSSIDVFNDASGTLASTGQTAYQWNDQTSYNNHAIQSNSSNRPTYTSGGTCINEGKVLYFDKDENDFMSVTNDASFNTLSGLTLFMYFNKNDSQDWFTCCDVITEYADGEFTYPASPFGGWTVDCVEQNVDESYLRFSYSDPAESSPYGYNELKIRTPKLDDSASNEFELYTFRVGGSGGTEPTLIESWINTTFEDSELGDGSGITYTTTTEPLSIGGSSVSTNNPSPVSFGNYILYDGPLSNSAVTKVQNYIINRCWGDSPTPPSGDLLLDLDPTKGVYSDDGVTFASDGSDVYRWDDQSSYNNNAITNRVIYDSGSTDPTFNVFGNAGKPNVFMSWFNDETFVVDNSDADFDVQELTMIAVVEPYQTNPGSGAPLISNNCTFGGSGVNGYTIEVIGTSGNRKWAVWMQGTGVNDNFGNEPAYTGGTPQIVTWRFSAGTIGQQYVQINNEVKMSGDAETSINFGLPSDLLINSRFNAAVANCDETNLSPNLGMYVYRLMIYGEYLDDATINSFISDLNDFHDIY